MILKLKFDKNGIDVSTESYHKQKRPQKGKSLIEFPNDYTVIDLETTGFDSSLDTILECGALKVKNNQVVDSFQELIYHQEIDSFISKLTGITASMTKDARDEKSVLQDFIQFISDDIIVGFNVSFDINFLYDSSMRLFHSYFSNNYVDVMRIFRKATPELAHHRLKDLKKKYVIQEDAHRALADCQATYQGFLALQNDIIKYYQSFDLFKGKEFSALENSKIKAKDFEPNPQANIKHPLHGKNVVFTGTLSKYSRKQAWEIVASLGGQPCDSVTKKTDILVIGTQDPLRVNGTKSNKEKKAESLILKGNEIQILNEDIFYYLITHPDEM